MFTLNSLLARGTNGIHVANSGDMQSFDPGLMRPYRDSKNRVCVDVFVANEAVKDDYGSFVRNSKGQVLFKRVTEKQLVQDRVRKDLPVLNITSNATTLTKDQWIMVDQAAKEAVRKPMKAAADLAAANTKAGIDGMGTTILEYQRIKDAGEAKMAMSIGGMDHGNFAPTFDLEGLPLPISFCGFSLDERHLASSRRSGGMGLDTIGISQASRRVGELIEQTVIGTTTAYQYGASGGYANTAKVYGYLTAPDRITKTNMTAPTGPGNAATVKSEWLTCRNLLYAQNFYGPYIVYVSDNYDLYLDDQYSSSDAAAGTLREQLMKIPEILAIRRLDYLTTDNVVVFVQMGDMIEMIDAMPPTVLQYSTDPMLTNFVVMAIQVPRIQSVYVNTSTTGPATSTTAKSPICHATTS